MIRGADFARALEHARRQIELFKRLSATNPAYKGQLKSTRILLAAMSIIRESNLQDLIIEQVNKEELEDLFESVRTDGMPEGVNERRANDRRASDRREEDRRIGGRRMGDPISPGVAEHH